MLKLLGVTTMALSLFAGNAVAESQACDPAKLVGQIDRYSSQPFSALSFRVLSGLGDPGIDAASSFDDSWQSRDGYKKLAQSVIPSADQSEVGYDCRVAYPLSVLKDHIAKFGAKDPYVTQWVKVQAQVFDACTKSDSASPTLIDPLTGIDAAHDEAQREDRAYQVASVAFYKDKSNAIQLFRQIADSNSPHKAAARYNIANLLANGKQIDAARKEAGAILADPSLTSVHTITKQLLGYIANLEDTAAGWSTLINDSLATAAMPTAEILSSPDHKADFARALNDLEYAGIRAKDSDWWITGTLPENPTISKAIVDASHQSPMALWMMGGQTLYEKQQNLAWAFRGKLWQDYASSYSDKVLAVSPAGQQLTGLPKAVFEALKQGATEPDRAALWDAYQKQAQAVVSSCGAAPETSALAITAEQAFRAAAVQGRFDDIYAEMVKSPLRSTDILSNRLLPQLLSYLLSTGNVEEGRRFRDKIFTPDFLASFPESSRQQIQNEVASFSAWVAEDAAHWQSAVLANSTPVASPLLNFLTTDQLWQLAGDSRFNTEQRALLARAAWTREYALMKATPAASLKNMLALNPMLETDSQQLAKDYPKLTSEQLQLLLVLRNPRLSTMVNAPGIWSTDTLELSSDSSYTDVGSGDHNDLNWWCPLELDRHLGALRGAFDADAQIPWLQDSSEQTTHLVDPTLRSQVENVRERILASHPIVKAASWKGLQQLQAAPSAPKKLTLAAIAWAKTTRQPDGVAEALSLAVRATRYGCNWHGGHGAYSKQAQELLKVKFGTTSFAADTPYWFDCMDSAWNDKGERTTNCKPHTWPKQAIPGHQK